MSGYVLTAASLFAPSTPSPSHLWQEQYQPTISACHIICNTKWKSHRMLHRNQTTEHFSSKKVQTYCAATTETNLWMCFRKILYSLRWEIVYFFVSKTKVWPHNQVQKWIKPCISISLKPEESNRMKRRGLYSEYYGSHCICRQQHKQISALCQHIAGFLSVKICGTCSYHCEHSIGGRSVQIMSMNSRQQLQAELI